MFNSKFDSLLSICLKFFRENVQFRFFFFLRKTCRVYTIYRPSRRAFFSYLSFSVCVINNAFRIFAYLLSNDKPQLIIITEKIRGRWIRNDAVQLQKFSEIMKFWNRGDKSGDKIVWNRRKKKKKWINSPGVKMGSKAQWLDSKKACQNKREIDKYALNLWYEADNNYKHIWHSLCDRKSMIAWKVTTNRGWG